MRSNAATYARFLTMFAVLGVLGIASTIYVLIQQRVTLPFEDVYTIRAEFTAADGVLGGIGQPVEVVGVKVGQVSGVELESGRAVVTMQLQREDLPRVYANATADLRPVTPLGDARIELRPGRPPAPELDNGALINLAATSAPVHLSDLLSRLDADTRGYLAGLLGSLERGTHDAGPDLRRMLLSLAPTTAQLRGISHALAQRRTELSTFVHNLSRLTHAASRDGRLASVVAAGNQTLEALAEQEQPLRESLAQLPATLTVAESTLSKLRPFATKLGPTLSSLEPALNRLPDTIDGLGRFSRTSAEVLRDDVTPLVSRAQPLLREANPAVSNLTESTPALTTAAQTLNYFLNELAFVPGADNQGFLFWLAWAAHNLNSGASTGDANGSLLRGAVLVDCHGLQSYPLLSDVFPKLGVCPQ